MNRSWIFFLPLFLFAATGLLRADQTVAAVQQALKEQGFYYGEVTGNKNADTTAAIRRYQIRNGLQITGEIDAETLRSLGVGSAAQATPAPQPAVSPNESPNESTEEENSGQSAEIPGEQQPPEESNQPGARAARPGVSGVFAGTPYEMAPPDVQRHVIVGAQVLLARRGLYRSGIDGQFGAGTEAAVREFQRRVGLMPDGRLNMDTLAALGLLPGQHQPGLPFRRRPFPNRPIYRGQWIPE